MSSKFDLNENLNDVTRRKGSVVSQQEGLRRSLSRGNNPLPPSGMPRPPKAANPLNRPAPGWLGKVPSPNVKKPYDLMSKAARNGIASTSEGLRKLGSAAEEAILFGVPAPNSRGATSSGIISGATKTKSLLGKANVFIDLAGQLLFPEPVSDGTIYGKNKTLREKAYEEEIAKRSLRNSSGGGSAQASDWSNQALIKGLSPSGNEVVTPTVYPFEGGQSTGIQYYLNFTVTRSSGATETFTNYGALSGRFISFYLSEGNLWVLRSSPYGAGTLTPYWDLISFKILSIYRADGQPDTGGNPPPISSGVSSSSSPIKLSDNFTESPQQIVDLNGTGFYPRVLPPSVISSDRINSNLSPVKKDDETTLPTPKELEKPTSVPNPIVPLPVGDQPITTPVPGSKLTPEGESVRTSSQPVSPLNSTSTSGLGGRVVEYDADGNPISVTDTNPITGERTKVDLTKVPKSESDKLRPGNPEAPGSNTKTPLSPDLKKDPLPLIPIPLPIPPNNPPTNIDPKTGQPVPPEPEETPVVQTPAPANCGCNAPLLAGQQEIKNKLDNPSSPVDLTLLGIINGKLGNQVPGGISGFMTQKFTSLWADRVIDRAINLLTLATTIHNATMLSNNIGQTLVSAANNILQVIGIKDADGVTKGITDAIGNTVESVITSVIGQENYTNLTDTWKKANRIYQATTNIFSALTDSLYGITESIELVGKYNSKIGNALKASGTVLENYYDWMSESWNAKTGRLGALQRFINGLNTAQEVAEDIENITSNAVNITENINTIKTESQAVKAQFEAKETEKKDEQDVKKSNSSSPNISITDLIKPES